MSRVVDGTAPDQLARAQAGDRRALEELLAEIRPRVFRYCLSRTGDPALADDISQEVAMTIVTVLPRYQDQGRPFVAFAFGIAANKLAEARRSSGRRHEDPVALVPEHRDPTPGPEQAALSLEATRQVRELLARLPERQAEVVRLRVAAGLSAEETAATLGMTAGAVRVAQHRGLAQLRRLLAGDAT